MPKTITSLEAENERLKKTLRYIADRKRSADNPLDAWKWVHEFCEIARRTLAGEETYL